jgi:solute carrier family 35, member E1
VTSAASGIWNKWLVDTSHVNVTTLTLLHLCVGLASDSTIRRVTDDGKAAATLAVGTRRTPWDVVAAFAPIALFVTLSKLTTYLSYQRVSMALAHTAKASEPIFNVIVAAVVFGEFHSREVYLSLVPISLGIGLASVSDFTYNHEGFFVAVASALMKVLQNIYTKRLLETGRFTFWEVHLYCGAASLLILAPVLYVQQVTLGSQPFSHFPVFALFLDSLLQWASSVSAYVVLSHVSHLTATIVNVMKRLVMIVSGGLLMESGLSFLNGTGVLLALVGVLVYNLVHDASITANANAAAAGGGGAAASAVPGGPRTDEQPWITLARGCCGWLRVVAVVVRSLCASCAASADRNHPQLTGLVPESVRAAIFSGYLLLGHAIGGRRSSNVHGSDEEAGGMMTMMGAGKSGGGATGDGQATGSSALPVSSSSSTASVLGGGGGGGGGSSGSGGGGNFPPSSIGTNNSSSSNSSGEDVEAGNGGATPDPSGGMRRGKALAQWASTGGGGGGAGGPAAHLSPPVPQDSPPSSHYVDVDSGGSGRDSGAGSGSGSG